VNGGFFTEEDQLLKQVHKIRHIPCTIAQGRYDVVCPAKSAWDLHKAYPEAELFWITDAGHSCKEDGTLSVLVNACDKYASL
jgi:proline iminopeptidase